MSDQYKGEALNNKKVYKVVLSCPECGQKLRLPVYKDKKLHVTCPKCGKEFLFDKRDNRDRHLFSSKIGELFKMDYSAVSQAAKRFE